MRIFSFVVDELINLFTSAMSYICHLNVFQHNYCTANSKHTVFAIEVCYRRYFLTSEVVRVSIPVINKFSSLKQL